MFSKRIPELPYNGLFPSNGLMAWYLPDDDTTYHLKGSDIISGLLGPDDAWSAVFTYDDGDIVSDGGLVYVSNGPGNLGNPPGPASLFWTVGAPASPPVTAWLLNEPSSLYGAGTVINSDQVLGAILGGGVGSGFEFGFFEAHVNDNAIGTSDLYLNPNGFAFGSADLLVDNATSINGNNSLIGMSAFEISTGQFNAFINPNNGFQLLKSTFIDDQIQLMEAVALAADSNSTLPGYGVKKTIFGTNDSAESYEMGNEIWVYTDTTLNSEDIDYYVNGSDNGVILDFFKIRGGSNREFSVFGPLKLLSSTVGGVPSAAAHEGSIIYISNESGGKTIAFSDGADWRRVQDRAIIS